MSDDCAVIRPQNLPAISPKNEMKQLAEIILDNARIEHDLRDKIELVRFVGEKLLPDLVTSRECLLVLIF